MRKRISLTLLSFILFLFFPSKNAFADTDSTTAQEWVVIGEGVEYRKFHFNEPRPMDIFVTRMDRSNMNLIIDTGIAQGRLSGGTETVLGMANRYDQAINYWGKTWGNRNQVVVAINGYYFNNQSSQGTIGVPWSGQIHSGWYAKRFDDYSADAGFVWKHDRKAFIGDCVYHKSSKQFVSFENSDYQPNLKATNVLRNDEELILYTPQYDSTTRTSSTSDQPIIEILVEMTRPTLILPSPAKALGHIREIRNRQGSTQLPFDHIVLTAWGAVRDTLLNRINLGQIAVGDSIGISQEISICPDSPFNDWTKAYAGVGGDYHFLNDGVIRTNFNNPDAWVPNSRTAVAYNPSYIYFMVIDRWNPDVSEGITIPELADFAKNTLQTTDAVAQDSGGSSTLVLNGVVVNNTDCNFTDCRSSELSSTNSANPSVERISPELFWNQDENLYGVYSNTTMADVAPLVANTLMMVLVEEKEQSDNFDPGGYAIPMTATEIRLGPGTNYANIGTAQENAIGVFQDHSNHLNGVLATGDYWWKASFGGLTGWVKESDLLGSSPGLTADFEAAPKEGPAPLVIDFTDTSIGDYSEILWDFGDGETSTISNPVHTYTSKGIYTPTLTISGLGGVDQHKDVIQVSDKDYQIFLPLIQYLGNLFQAYFPVIQR